MVSNKLEDVLKMADSTVPIIYFNTGYNDPLQTVLKYCHAMKIEYTLYFGIHNIHAIESLSPLTTHFQ